MGTADAVCFPNDSALGSSTKVYATRTRVISGVDVIDIGVTATWTLAGLAQDCAGGNITIAIENLSGDGGFLPNTKYFYKISYSYDGYQYSPLAPAFVWAENAAEVTSNKSINIRITDKRQISDRVSHIILWRASGGIGAAVPNTQYRMVYMKSTTTPDWVVTDYTASFTYIDSLADEGSTFDSVTGFSETLDSNFIKWGLAVEYNGQLFVTRCIHPELSDASHMIFRSKKGRLDTFDWITDYLKLPEIPNAIVAYAGRLFVFTANNTYKIDPEQFYVEDVFKGIGCWSPKGVCVTEDLMYVADKENIYAYDGRSFAPIGEPIRTCVSAATVCSTDITALLSGWKGIDHTNFYPILAYSSRLQSLLVLVSTGTVAGHFLVYTPARAGMRQYARWDYWNLPVAPTASSLAGLAIWRNGEAYYSDYSAQYELCTGNRVACTYYTGYLGLGNHTQNKRFYFAIGSGSFSTIGYDLNNSSGAYTTLTDGKIPISYSLKKYLKLKFVTAANVSAPLRSVDLIVRKLIGARSY